MSSKPHPSPIVQGFIETGLFDQLPVTFSTYCFDQLKDWALLFAAEKDYFERLFGLIGRSDPAQIQKLFAPLLEVEAKMGVNEKVWSKRQFTLDQVDFLNRSPQYPEWRKAIAQIFSSLDPVLNEEIARVGRARLVVVTSPAELPVGPDRMWTRFRQHGKLVPLALSSEDEIQDYLPQVLTGAKSQARGKTLAELYVDRKARSAHDAWIIEAGTRFSRTTPEQNGLVRLSYDGLLKYRTRLMTEVDKLLKTQNIRGPRQLGEQLKQLHVLPSENECASDPVLAEFLRSVFLSGNGTLLINNTFVEWSTIQAVRRARPSVVLVSFGIRNKIKPFSSLLIYTDQESSNPVPSQMDALGSYVDLEVLLHYVWMEFEKYPEFRRNTVYYFLGEGMDEMLVLAPSDFPLLTAQSAVPLSRLFELAKEWIQV
jgi:hypothetical protein